MTTLKEHTDNTIPTLLALMLELKMPAPVFQEWMRDTATLTKPPAADKLIEFVERYHRGLVGSVPVSLPETKQSRQYALRPQASQQKKPYRSLTFHVRESAGCKLCGDNSHPLFQCPELKAMSVEQRQQRTQSLKVCSNCLGSDHNLRNCPSKRSCKTCGKRHHTLLHRADLAPSHNRMPQPQRQAPPPMSTEPSLHHYNADAPPSSLVSINHTAADPPCLAADGSMTTILGTCVTRVEHRGVLHKARALLDSGSGLSFVTSRFVNCFGLRKISQPTRIKGFQQADTPAIKYQVEFSLRVPLGAITILRPMQALVVESITGDLPSGPLPVVRDQPFLQGLKPAFDKPGRVDLLLGVDSLPLVMGGSIVYSEDRLLWATETAYGWVISGKCHMPQQTPRSHLCLTTGSIDQQTQDLLIKFLETESLASTDTKDPIRTQEEQRAEDHFSQTHSRQQDGRYVVQLPRKVDHPTLGCSREQALRRHHQNTASLARKGKLQEFQDAIWDYARHEHAERVPPRDLLKPESETFYLPTHGVVKDSSTTTKLRIVFDASASSTTGTSLNDQLLAGPNLYPQLVPILLNFRSYNVGMTADIGKMFREIALDTSEKDFHRFLMTGENGQTEDWRMRRLTFGVTSSPFLATQVLRHAAITYKNKFPEASDIILHRLYVDDCITGATTVDDAIRIRKQLNELLQCICMTLRKWRSNNQELLQTIPEDIRESETVQFFSPKGHHKALGIHWDTTTDCLHVATPAPSTVVHPTKRQVSSEVARVYYPLGWFAPSVVILKILLQRLWKLGKTWDRLVPEDIAMAWRDWQMEQHFISQFPIPRHFFHRGKQKIDTQIHGFSDASNVAYGGVVYIRTTYHDSTVSVHLLLAKTKVVPLNPPGTTPRLELCGALLLSQLLQTVMDTLDVPTDQVYAWSDSTITLNWLNFPPGSHNAYVTNRVAKTVKRVPADRWKHVPTVSNPADLASRGILPKQLTNSKLWWQGPDWLIQEPDLWPDYNGWRRKQNEIPEMTCHMVRVEPTTALIERFSSYRRMLRVISWCRRFCANAKLKKPYQDLSITITLDEINATEIILLQQSQTRSFPQDIAHLEHRQELSRKSSLLQRGPFLDSNKILRVGGRLQRIDIPQDQRHPVILHRRDLLTKLLCWQCHLDNMHIGPSGLIALLSIDYHVIGAKQLVRDVSKNCVKCQRYYGKTTAQLMGQLPACRASPAPPFTNTGADFAGPFNLRKGYTRRPTYISGYACIFVCLTTRAVHLELVMDLTTEAFLAALRRFIARRGRPAKILTDNGTNFVGARREIDAAYDIMDLHHPDESLLQYLADQRIKWSHTPARSPHFGGIWEAGVKQMKALLYKTLGPYKLTTEQFYSILTETEAILNCRPLLPMDSSPTDGAQVLTPAHFLVGRSLKSLPTKLDPLTSINLLKHWRLCQRLIQDIWDKWSGIYLQHLQHIHRWRHPKRSLQVGDVVLLKDPELFQRSWPLAVVELVHPGPDGLVRVVTLRTSKGSYRRAVTRIVPLVSNTSAAGPREGVQA